jgi:hypothetical protein
MSRRTCGTDALAEWVVRTKIASDVDLWTDMCTTAHDSSSRTGVGVSVFPPQPRATTMAATRADFIFAAKGLISGQTIKQSNV